MTDQRDVDRNYKVGRVLADYDHEDLHEQLPALWLGDAEVEEHSLRTLAKRINVALVRRALERAGEDPLEGEPENVYHRLTSDDVSAGVRIQQRNRLERRGIDVDQLEGDFVTHQAVYTYLTEGLDVSKDTSTETDPVEKHETRIQRLRSRLNAVMDQSLAELQAADDLTTGELDTTVSLQIFCQDCETQYELSELFEQGGCSCDSS